VKSVLGSSRGLLGVDSKKEKGTATRAKLKSSPLAAKVRTLASKWMKDLRQ
jgi:hypothetical protein